MTAILGERSPTQRAKNTDCFKLSELPRAFKPPERGGGVEPGYEASSILCVSLWSLNLAAMVVYMAKHFQPGHSPFILK